MIAFSHGHWLEYVWLIAAVLLTGRAIWALMQLGRLHQAIRSRVVLRPEQEVVFEMSQRTEQFRLAKGMLMFTGAAVACLTAPPPPVYLEVPQSLVGVIINSVITMSMFFQSVLDRQSDTKLEEYAREFYRRDRRAGDVPRDEHRTVHGEIEPQERNPNASSE